jgi:hypothetical protein
MIKGSMLALNNEVLSDIVEMWRGPVNLQNALMIWGSKIWGCGVALYTTTTTLIASCGIRISSRSGCKHPNNLD